MKKILTLMMCGMLCMCGAGGASAAGRETYSFQKLPTNVAELQSMPEYSGKSPYAVAALTVAVLCNYEKNPDETINMLNALKGPQPLSNYEKQFLRDRLVGKGYKPMSFFAGTSPQNNYTPSLPYTITITSNPYSFKEANYAKLFIKSSGADSERQITLRQKPSTGQWFLWDQMLLSDIRIPVASDPWS